jgi:glycogen operon protein
MMQVGSNSKPATPNSGLDSAEQSLPTIGRSAPLGASVEKGGVNFSVYSRDATRIDLLLFDSEDAPPSRVIHLDPSANRTYHYWHVFVPGLQPGQLYGYRAHGPFDPSQGQRFDASKVLLDPYGREVAGPLGYSREAARNGGDNSATSMKSVVVDPHTYDWEGDVPLHRLSSQTVIYEMHVGGFTRHPNSDTGGEFRFWLTELVRRSF